MVEAKELIRLFLRILDGLRLQLPTGMKFSFGEARTVTSR